jgi:hypothetical protein
MLTLDTALRIPEAVLFATVDGDAVLLNTRSNTYFSLTEVGARLWNLLSEGRSFRAAYESILDEYEVDGAQLERDLLDLVGRLRENGLVESVSA